MDIVVFGGTFDPPHLGHQSIVNRLVAGGHKVIVLPNRTPPHKSGVTPADIRMEMCRLAFPQCEVSDLELRLPEPSYTYNTLLQLKTELGLGDKTLKYIIGADSMRDLSTWRNPNLLAQLAEFVVVPRAGYPEVQQYIDSFRRKYGGSFVIMDEGVEDISSSEARILNCFGELGEVVDTRVADYIKSKKLYEDYINIVQMFDEFGITPHRKKHIKNVALTAQRLAKIYKVDGDSTIVAALLHDIAKYKDQLAVKKWGVKVSTNMLKGLPPPCMHAEIGAQVAEQFFGVEDEDILNAIRYHTTGREEMSTLEKIIYLADYIEPSRPNNDTIEEIRMAASKDLDKAMVLALNASLKYVLSSGESPAEISFRAAKYYSQGLANTNQIYNKNN